MERRWPKPSKRKVNNLMLIQPRKKNQQFFALPSPIKMRASFYYLFVCFLDMCGGEDIN